MSLGAGQILQSSDSLPACLAPSASMPPASLTTGARQRPVVVARAAVAAVAVEGLGLPGAAVARALGVTPMAIWRGVPRGLAALRARGLDPRRLARAAMK